MTVYSLSYCSAERNKSLHRPAGCWIRTPDRNMNVSPLHGNFTKYWVFLLTFLILLFQLTYPDFHLYETLDIHKVLEPSCLDNFPKLQGFIERFEVKGYISILTMMPPPPPPFLILIVGIVIVVIVIIIFVAVHLYYMYNHLLITMGIVARL